MIFHLVRHPPPDFPPGFCYGWLDVPALEVESTARRLKACLPENAPLWSSPLRRCRALAECLHPAPRWDARLREMHFGAWEGQSWDAIPRDQLDAWAADPAGFCPPGGESAQALHARAAAFIEEVACLPGCPEEIVVVTHGGVIRTLLAHAGRIPLTGPESPRIDFGSVNPLPVRPFLKPSGLGRGPSSEGDVA